MTVNYNYCIIININEILEFFGTQISGDDGVEETLLPIPNRTVKLYSVNGTAWVTVWESRTLPGKASSLILDAFFYCMPSMGNNLTVKVLLWDW